MTLCPYCQSEGAYIGGLTVECPSPSCRFFSARQIDEVARGDRPVSDPSAIHRLWDVTGTNEPRPAHPVWVWSNNHHDFGDV